MTARCLARCSRYTSAMIQMRLTSSVFWVDVRLLEINGRWIASADTPDGPSLGVGELAVEAIEGALQPFRGPHRRATGQHPGRLGRENEAGGPATPSVAFSAGSTELAARWRERFAEIHRVAAEESRTHRRAIGRIAFGAMPVDGEQTLR